MQFDLTVPGHLMAALAPDLVVSIGAMVLLLWASWHRESDAHQERIALGSALVALLGIIAVVVFLVLGASAGPGIIAVDNFRWTSDLIFLVTAIIAIALAVSYNRREGITAGESHVLVLFATSGMMLLAAARDLIIVFLGIELMSVSTYVLAGLNRRSSRAAEAALKYFLLGAFSSTFLLYGIALIYGAAGSTNIAEIGERVARMRLTENPLLLVGIGLLLVGFAFKIAAAPFHMWVPDVYEGAPTPYTGFMAAAVKAAAFAAFLRVWLEAFPLTAGAWHAAVWWLAVVTMVFGNVVALAQRNVKRLLAYSSIAHAGYLLVAVAAGTVAGASAFVFYLIAYTLATMGAFAVVIALGRAGERDLDITDYAGLWTVRPELAVAMAVFMLALLGVPIAGGMGFFAKWYVLQAALQSPAPQTTSLAVVLVLASVVSAGYYLYVIMVMFMRPRSADAPVPGRVPRPTSIVIGAAAAVLFFFGVFPSAAVRLARASTPVVATDQSAGPAPPTASQR